jgi:CBS domain-containing protein
VVDETGGLSGIVTARDIERSLNEDPERPVSEVMRSPVITAQPAQSVADALAQPGARDVRQLVVVDRSTRGALRPIGILGRGDVVAAYLRVRDREARAVRRARSAGPGGEGAIELRVRPATDAAGRTLAELRLPRGALVTRIERDGAAIVPDGSVRLEPGDRLQIAAADEMRPELLRRFTAIAASTDAANDAESPAETGH